MGTYNSSASALTDVLSAVHTNQLPQGNPELRMQISPQQRTIRIAVSPRKSHNKVGDPDRSAWMPKTPEKIPSQPAKEQASNSTRKSLSNGDASTTKTPDSHGLKRKPSHLTSPLNAGVPRPRDAMMSEAYRSSLGEPPSFNLDSIREQISNLSEEPRRTKPCVLRITSRHGFRPAPTLDQNVAGGNLNSSITNDDCALSSVGLQGPPSYIHGNQHDEHDDLQGPIPRSDHDARTFPSAQDLKGSQCHNHRPIVRKLAPYAARPPKSLATEMIILETMIKPLTMREMGIATMECSSGNWKQQTSHEGWIYIYQISNELNTVKIGVTQGSVMGRLRSWTEQCGHETLIAYPRAGSDWDPVPNIYRLEALVQAELAATRLEEVKCFCCGKRHIEWFEEAVAHAIEVVAKWSKWMRKSPYIEVQADQWHLSPQYIPDLAELSRPSPKDYADGSALNPIRI